MAATSSGVPGRTTGSVSFTVASSCTGALGCSDSRAAGWVPALLAPADQTGAPMASLPLAVLLLVFAGAAAAIWVAGVQLSRQTDVLSTRLHLGAALGGLILLAIATNLPEIAIVVSAAASDQVEVAVGNILGGIAIQTVVLVALDVFGIRGDRPLTYRAASLVLVLEALLVVAVLAVVVSGSQLPASLVVWRLTP